MTFSSKTIWEIIGTSLISVLLGFNIWILNNFKQEAIKADTNIIDRLNVNNCTIKDVDNKLFAHLTNDEIHVPRGQIVSKAEFTMHEKFADKIIEEIQRQNTIINDKIDNLNRTIKSGV